jgi:hypothetical protein
VTYRWTPGNLKSHYGKHPGGDCRSCWTTLLQSTTPVDETGYESASLHVISAPSMTFSALYQKNWNSAQVRTQYFIDERLLVTAAVGISREISTCFRWHAGKWDHSTQCDLPVWLNMIRRFSEKRYSIDGRMDDYRNVLSRLEGLSSADQKAVKEALRKLTAAPDRKKYART